MRISTMHPACAAALNALLFISLLFAENCPCQCDYCTFHDQHDLNHAIQSVPRPVASTNLRDACLSGLLSEHMHFIEPLVKVNLMQRNTWRCRMVGQTCYECSFAEMQQSPRQSLTTGHLC